MAFQPELGSKQRLSRYERKALKRYGEFYRLNERQFYQRYRRMIAQASEACRAAGIPFIDLNSHPGMVEHGGTLFIDQVHLNAAGYRRAAKLIERDLLRGLGY